VVAIFHTNAGHVTLHDQAYNPDRNIATGNPYRQLVTDLMERGVQVELCGATAKVHGWETQTSFPESRSTPMPWPEQHNLFRKVS
jgi:sulfur relay (sulfurtransferase) complex TusBCD TusD component (DsrE family)